MGEFIAKERLSPEDFKGFSSQCLADHERAVKRLKEAEADQQRANDTVRFWSERVSGSVVYCAKHGVSLYAV